MVLTLEDDRVRELYEQLSSSRLEFLTIATCADGQSVDNGCCKDTLLILSSNFLMIATIVTFQFDEIWHILPQLNPPWNSEINYAMSS